MDLAIILPLVEKGISIASALLTAKNVAGAERAWTAVSRIVKPPGQVTQADLDALEEELDELIDLFNVPLA